MNVEFEVEVDGKPRHVVIRFGTERDVRALGRWHFRKKPGQGEAILDALEYARLASKRWRYNQRLRPDLALNLLGIDCSRWRNTLSCMHLRKDSDNFGLIRDQRAAAAGEDARASWPNWEEIHPALPRN